MPGRHSFTDADDDHLVEFIAKNNPDLPGRFGNKLYKTLVENPKRWPWSRSHPWQSWRERYKKNPVLFDRRIKRYQRAARVRVTKESEEGKQGKPKERTGEDDYMHELFGSSTEDEGEDVADPEDPPASSAPSSPPTEGIYPDLRNVPPPHIAETGSHSVEITRSVRPSRDSIPLKTDRNRLPSSSPPPPLPAAPLKGEKRLSKRKVLDHDPFIDSTPPPSPTERHVTMRGAPPVLNEGPFRNRYVRTRNPAENQGVVWPPNRKRNENEGPSQTTEVHAPPTEAMVGRKTHQQVNAVASSSKVKLPASNALQPGELLLIGTAQKTSAQHSVPKTQATTTAVGSDNRTKTNGGSCADGTEQPTTKRQKFGHLPTTHDEPTHGALASVAKSSPVHSQGNARDNHERPATRIDLRASLKKRHLRSGKSSVLSSRASTASTSASLSNHPSRRVSVASSTSLRRHVSNDEDEKLISLLERDLAELGEQYGFALGVVKKTYLQFGTLEKTVVVLRALNAIMKGAQDKLYEELQFFDENGKDHDTDDEELIPDGVIPKLASSGGKGKGKEIREGGSRGTPSNKRHRQSLNYKPLTTDVEDQSEYSPPSRTRAGRYTKLQKEGREEEALVAASGGRFAVHKRNENREEQVSGGREVQHHATMIKRGMEPSSPLDSDRGRSPTPDEEKSVGPSETEVEEEDDDDDIGFAIGHDRMDVSPDHSAVREPTPEVEQVEQVDEEELKLKAEHKKLCSEVTLGIRDVLRGFVDREDSILLKGLNGEWIKERIATLTAIQELRRQESHRTEATKEEEYDG